MIQMQNFLMVWLDPGTGSRMLVLSNRFYLECQDQISGSDCPIGCSEKDSEPLSELNRKECSHQLVMSDTGTGMRRDSSGHRLCLWTWSGAEVLQFLLTRAYWCEPKDAAAQLHHLYLLPKWKRTQRQQRIKRAEITTKIEQSIS